MDKKIKQFAVVSLVALMATGCSNYRGASQGGGGYATGTTGSDGYSTGGRGYGQVARTGQVNRRGGGFGQSQRSSTAATTCAPCNAAPKQQKTYTYQPATKQAPIRRAQPARQAGQHSQQWYIDRWNRQQNGQKTTQRNTQQSKNANYSGYGSNASNTTYYDYSSAGKKTTAAPANTNVATSNKSIYTGSYQQKTYKPYQPTTYSGGSTATTNTTSTVSTSSSGSSTYVVKKGDTVFEIMRQTGVYWKDIISLNNLTPPYSISPGQTIRLK
ncbi:MAG: LysM domain-containing protein [Cocleimonas sp.]